MLTKTLTEIQNAMSSNDVAIKSKLSKIKDSKEAARLTKEGIAHVQDKKLKKAKKAFMNAAKLDSTNGKRWYY